MYIYIYMCIYIGRKCTRGACALAHISASLGHSCTSSENIHLLLLASLLSLTIGPSPRRSSNKLLYLLYVIICRSYII